MRKILFCLLIAVGLCLMLTACQPQPTSEPTTQPISFSYEKQVVKIGVRGSGLYRVNFRDLAKVGFILETVEIERLHLSYRGRSQPFWIDEEQEALIFYAAAEDSIYTESGIYWLEKISAQNAQAEDTLPWTQRLQPVEQDGLSDHYMAVERLEMDQVYSPMVDQSEHWFWASLPAPGMHSYEFELHDMVQSDLVEELSLLRLAVWGTTEALTVNPDHHLRVSLNGQEILNDGWDGKGARLTEVEFKSGILLDGANLLEINAPGDTEAPVDIILIDYVEIVHPRALKAQSDYLAFDAPGEVAVLSGFSGKVYLFDVTETDHAVRLGGFSQSGGEVTLSTSPGRRYIAIGPKGWRLPDSLTPPVMQPDLRSVEHAVDYIALGPDELLAPLQPLIDRRNAQGLRTLVLPLQSVYDQFNAGMPEPEAVKKFLQYARENWQAPPRFLLLVGDASYDPRGYLAGENANLLPTFFIQTHYGGQTGSDLAFALLDQDDRPDIAVGRLPARNASQLTAWVQKILDYEEDDAEGEWRRRILAIADGQEASFQLDAQEFLDRFGSNYQGELFSPPVGEQNASQAIIDYFETGYWIVAYFGHGSINMWGKDRLFQSENVNGMNHAHYPVVVSWSCLNGLFMHPKVESLAETFLWNEHGGAVAVFAPTSLTMASDQAALSQPFVDAVSQANGTTWGEAYLSAQRVMPLDYAGQREVLATFLLFGDPALRIIYP